MVRSSLALITVCPSGPITMRFTGPAWPESTPISLAVSTDQILTAPRSSPLSTTRPSAVMATDMTRPPFWNVLSFSPVRIENTRTVPSMLETATRPPSAESARSVMTPAPAPSVFSGAPESTSQSRTVVSAAETSILPSGVNAIPPMRFVCPANERSG